jgi:hypothetical protein
MTAVVAVLVILLTAGVGLMKGTGTRARLAATDMLAGMIEQARASAITTRSYVILAVAEPGDLPAGDERCRLGLFQVETWPDSPSEAVEAVLMTRWRTMENGIALIGGSIDGIPNPLNGPQLTVSYGAPKPLRVNLHVIAFNPRGGLHFPSGSTPVALRIAEGSYRDGKATPYPSEGGAAIIESRLKIGRVIARPHRIDG